MKAASPAPTSPTDDRYTRTAVAAPARPQPSMSSRDSAVWVSATRLVAKITPATKPPTASTAGNSRYPRKHASSPLPSRMLATGM